MSLSEIVPILGRGPSRSRSLTQQEAHRAMTAMLSPEAEPQAVGAILMLLRMKGEIPEEIAGFAAAARAALGPMPQVDLDWPSYAAGRTRGSPWFLLAAKLVAQSGRRVLLHGWNGMDSAVRDALAPLDIPVARNAPEAEAALAAGNIAYMPLEEMHPALFALLDLRRIFGLRSCVNTVCRMLNPCGADISVQGTFHPSYRLLQSEAAALLGWQALTVIKGGGGEFERHPCKAVEGFGLRDGLPWDSKYPQRMEGAQRLSEVMIPPDALGRAWQQGLPAGFAEEAMLGTAELAFEALGAADPNQTVSELWAARPQPQVL